MRWVPSYIVATVKGCECIRLHMLAHGKLVRYLEQGRKAHGLCQIGTKSGVHIVGERNFALDLLANRVQVARVCEAELGSPFREGSVDIVDGIREGVGGQKAQRRGWLHIEAGGHDGCWMTKAPTGEKGNRR
jgi:hypothetical protein